MKWVGLTGRVCAAANLGEQEDTDNDGNGGQDTDGHEEAEADLDFHRGLEVPDDADRPDSKDKIGDRANGYGLSASVIPVS